jgi:hypothetical protein
MTRKRIFQTLLSIPCTFLIENNHDYKAVTVYPQPNTSDLLSRTWHLSNTNPNLSLPFHSDLVVNKDAVFKGSMFPNGYTLIGCAVEHIPVSANRPNKPMSEHTFTYYYDNIFNPINHQNLKKAWLWRRFVQAYQEKIKISVDLDLELDLFAMQAEMDYVRNYCYKYWQYWDIWQQHIFAASLEGPVAPELIFNAIAFSYAFPY